MPPASPFLLCCDRALGQDVGRQRSTKDLIQRDRDLFQSGFLERLNSLTHSQLYNIVRGCSQKLGLEDPSRLVEVTDRLGSAVLQISHLQTIVKVRDDNCVDKLVFDVAENCGINRRQL